MVGDDNNSKALDDVSLLDSSVEVDDRIDVKLEEELNSSLDLIPPLTQSHEKEKKKKEKSKKELEEEEREKMLSVLVYPNYLV